MHITIDKSAKDGYWWFLSDDNGTEIYRTAFFPNEKVCALNALSFQVIIELGGKSVTVRKSYDSPGQFVTASGTLRHDIERICGKPALGKK